MNEYRERRLTTRHLGQRVHIYDHLDSTNNRCMEFVRDEAKHGLAVLAHSQSAGRGQHGRSWTCEPGMGVLLSVLLFPPAELCRPVLLTAWAAVSVCRLIEEAAGLQPTIKWPNDVLIGRQKLCGILIEQQKGVVCGIGLNLNQSKEALLANDLTEATSLFALTDRTFEVEEVACRLIQHLDDHYEQMIGAQRTELQSHWQGYLGVLNRTVIAEGHGSNYQGRLVDVTFDGLVLESEYGDPVLLRPEEVRHVRVIYDQDQD